MSAYKYVFFDLDGTISDSAPGIVNSVIYALDKMGAPYGSREELKRFVGPPLFDSFAEYCGFNAQQVDEAVKLFRIYYREYGIHENTMYPGIPELLESLKAGGERLVLATSKPEPFAREIVAGYGISDYFEYIAGSTLDETRIKKHEVINYAMDTLGLRDTGSIVMVGDRKHDVEGSAVFGIDCIGVLFGYGSREELLTAGAKFLAETPEDVAKIILN